MGIEVLFTVDYELFLGKNSGTVQNCLIKPANHLLPLFKKFGVKSTVFFDVLYLLRLIEGSSKTPNLAKDLRKVREEAARWLEAGHEFELHLHPHWLDARYNGEQWEFRDLRRYRLHALKENSDARDLETIEGCITRGCQAIEELCHESRSSYRVSAFRAGGWCLEPFHLLRPALEKNGIFVDSSVARDVVVQNGIHDVDFRGAPDKDAWFFEDSSGQEKPSGRFVELPISTFLNTPLEKVGRRLAAAAAGSAAETWGDGTGIPLPRRPFLSQFTQNAVMMSFESLTATELINGVKSLIERGHQRVTLIGHPKNLSLFMVREIGKFLDHLAGQGVTFVTVRDAAERFRRKTPGA